MPLIIVREGNDLFRHIAVGIIVILNGIYYNFRGYYIVSYNYIRLSSTNNSAFLILIIILLFARNVNRADDITVAIVDIEKLRTWQKFLNPFKCGENISDV